MNNPDYLIIGGGIAGISVGARLSEKGSVMLLEAESALGYHSTGRSAAMYAPNYGNEVIRALNRKGMSFFKSSPDLLRQRDVLVVAGEDDQQGFEGLLAAGFREIST
ncbi:MAG: FAD-binding oxidoreductase, partial [bacterium]|nr:FAD-binding oxidoreductase [bacterium]